MTRACVARSRVRGAAREGAATSPQVLENYHAAELQRLLRSPGTNLFAVLPKASAQAVRRITIDIILATDLACHATIVHDVATMLGSCARVCGRVIGELTS